MEKRKTPRSGSGHIILLVILLLLTGILLAGCGPSNKAPAPSSPDHTERILPVWETPAGNRPDSKLEEMNIDYTRESFGPDGGFRAIIGDDYRDVEQELDTVTWLREIKPGYEKETFEDEPFLIPYLSEGSDTAVIVIPGGGYVFKSIDSDTREGNKVARTLQQNGLNVFVLHYRSNPYEYPLPLLDVQRAVRYLRHHAADYGLDPEKISLMGFSAGGYEAGGFIHLVQGRNLFPKDYTPDEVDREDDHVRCAALIYPALSFDHNVGVLFCLFNDEDVRDPVKRAKMLKNTDLKTNLTPSSDIPRFVAWGDADTVVGLGPKEYVDAVRAAGGDITDVRAPGQDHSFGQKYYMDEYLKWIREQ